MATRQVYEDDNGNQLDFYINKDSKLFMQIQAADKDPYVGVGYIVLEKEDVSEMIEHLNVLAASMQD